MKRVGKPVFFVVVLLIGLISFASFFGISTTYGDVTHTYIKGGNDVRWGIDIRGGVEVTFYPADGYDATEEEMAAAEAVIKVRLLNQNITDSEVYTDYDKDRIIVRYPWKEDETDFDAQQAVEELGQTAMLTFNKGSETDEDGKPTGEVILTGKDVESATAMINSQTNEPVVSLKFKTTSEDGELSGAEKFAQATSEMIGQTISIWMDDTMISNATVKTAIENGEASIEGNFTVDEAKDLANKINAGALPFALTTDNYSSISPTLGLGAKDAMLLAGAIAFALVAVFVIVMYRLPGVVAMIGIVGQVSLTVAAITGFFPGISSFVLTLPGIAGIILAIGIGVDANIITAERIREELAAGKTIDGAIDAGFSRAFAAIFDSNITMILVAVVLMGAFGPPGSVFSVLLGWLFDIFGPSTAGVIYSFGYTLLVGVILNFLMGVFASRLMLKSLSRFKVMRNPWLYGGKKND